MATSRVETNQHLWDDGQNSKNVRAIFAQRLRISPQPPLQLKKTLTISCVRERILYNWMKKWSL